MGNSTVFPNIREPVMEVRHSELERMSEDSAFGSKCPVCENGFLLVYREPGSFELAEFDRCISCGQIVKYLDIEDLRALEEPCRG